MGRRSTGSRWCRPVRELQFTQMDTRWHQRTSSGCSHLPGPGRGRKERGTQTTPAPGPGLNVLVLETPVGRAWAVHRGDPSC